MPETDDTPGGPADAQRGTSLTLLQRIRANQPEAWQTLVHLYTPLLYQWCSRAGVAGADADDVAQEVFRAVVAHFESFHRDRPGDTFRGWLRVITRNMIVQHFRRSGRQVQGVGGDQALERIQQLPDLAGELTSDADEQEASGLRWQALELVRAEFEERTWQMFWSSFVDERPPALIAADMGVTPAAVRKAKSRVLHRLKEQFADFIR